MWFWSNMLNGPNRRRLGREDPWAAAKARRKFSHGSDDTPRLALGAEPVAESGDLKPPSGRSGWSRRQMTADRPLLVPLSLHRCTGESPGQRQVVVDDVGIHGCNPATAASQMNPVASLADRPPTDVACDQVGTQPRSAPRQDLGYRPRDRTVVLTVP